MIAVIVLAGIFGLPLLALMLWGLKKACSELKSQLIKWIERKAQQKDQDNALRVSEEGRGGA